jgi:predicted small lipoprotein YifL
MPENTNERGWTMFKFSSLIRTERMSLPHPVGKGSSLGTQAVLLLLVAVTLAGCGSKLNHALDEAKKQAAATGQAQQVVSVDKNGTTTTTVVQPPTAGQKTEVITTTAMPPAPGAPIPAASEPTVSAVPQPVSVTIAAGTTLAIRIDQRISVKTSRAGDTFTGEIVNPVLSSDNHVLVPKGALVGGVVDVSHRRGHFKGSSLLELRLTSLTMDGKRYPLETRDTARSKKGKGRRSTAMIAGGSGLGMLVGGLATGGTGLVVGGLVGGGAGTAVAGLTGNRDIDIPAESIVHFKLADDLIVQTTE